MYESLSLSGGGGGGDNDAATAAAILVRKLHLPFAPMIGENRQLVTNETLEFGKLPVEVQDCREIT
jgi:hypothetical protein